MSSFYTSSIGKKVVMALSGLFLIVFLLVHLTANLTLFLGPEAFNAASHFMATNPLIQVMQPVLAAGFLVHIIMGVYFDMKNRAATPQSYAITKRAHASSFASRNMLILGVLVFAFLVLHMRDFFYVLKFGSLDGKTDYDLVAGTLSIWWYGLLYVVFFVALGFHLDHGFQSAFQTMGLNSEKTRKRMITIGRVYTLIVALGFSAIAIFFMAGMGHIPA